MMIEHIRLVGAWIAVVCHSALIIATAAFITSSAEPEMAMLWNVFILIDFPSSLLAIALHSFSLPFLISYLPPEVQSDASNVYLPAFAFSVFGGVQYYWLTDIAAASYCRRRGRKATRIDTG